MTTSQSAENNLPVSGIDHLLYACASLERGMDEIESLLGVRPVPGGRHPRYGTHNALLSLGPGIYLEVIARDPGLPAPERGAFIDIPASEPSRIFAWVLRTEDIGKTAEAGRAAGIAFGRIETGSRTQSDGSVISWQLTDPSAVLMDGAIPFLINWGDTPHPSGVVPAGGKLVELVIRHPDPVAVRRALSALGASIEVVPGDKVGISARIRTASGLKTLQ